MSEPEWPMVTADDPGIRLVAGRPNECFYCNRRVGEPHCRECVAVVKRVCYEVLFGGTEVVGHYDYDDPHHWTEHDGEFQKNEGGFCMDNLLNGTEWVDKARGDDISSLVTDDGCLCGVLTVRFLKVLDDTPRRLEN